MAAYGALSVQSVTSAGNNRKVLLVCARRLARPVSVHFPFAVAQAAVQPEIPYLSITDTIVRLGPLETGTYELSATMEGNASCQS